MRRGFGGASSPATAGPGDAMHRKAGLMNRDRRDGASDRGRRWITVGHGTKSWELLQPYRLSPCDTPL